VTFHMSLSESAGSRSLHRLVGHLCVSAFMLTESQEQRYANRPSQPNSKNTDRNGR
jgi:hypothetical protein